MIRYTEHRHGIAWQTMNINCTLAEYLATSVEFQKWPDVPEVPSGDQRVRIDLTMIGETIFQAEHKRWQIAPLYQQHSSDILTQKPPPLTRCAGRSLK